MGQKCPLIKLTKVQVRARERERERERERKRERGKDEKGGRSEVKFDPITRGESNCTRGHSERTRAIDSIQ